MGLGGAMLIAVYDYFGYYNVCHLGDEVIEPAKTIPRAVIFSVVIVAALYLTMNVAIIGVVPWKRRCSRRISPRILSNGSTAATRRLVHGVDTVDGDGLDVRDDARLFADPVRGRPQRRFLSRLRLPRAASRYPLVALLTIGGLTAVFCFFALEQVIEAAVTCGSWCSF